RLHVVVTNGSHECLPANVDLNAVDGRRGPVAAVGQRRPTPRVRRTEIIPRTDEDDCPLGQVNVGEESAEIGRGKGAGALLLHVLARDRAGQSQGTLALEFGENDLAQESAVLESVESRPVAQARS